MFQLRVLLFIKTYKKSSIQKLNNITGIAKQIAQKFTLGNRIEVMQEDEAYITIKDHKDEFPSKITCRLINRSKSSIGRISKHILDKIMVIIDKKDYFHLVSITNFMSKQR